MSSVDYHARDVALEAFGISRRFGDTIALDGVSLSVRHGELFGLVGPDGAGKTTLIRALSGLIGVHSGVVKVLGRDPLIDSSVREAMGVMPQHYSLYGDLSVEENLRFFSDLYCLSRRDYAERSKRLLELTRLTPFLERRAQALSGGMYKKLALACALLHEPRVLLLDEPTNGVDPVSRRELWALLHEFVGQGVAIVVSKAYMDEVSRCDAVCLLHQGRIIAEGTPPRLIRDMKLPVFEVRGGARETIHAVLGQNSAVIAASPAGERLRIVVLKEGVSSVERELTQCAAALHPVAADFEDVFLASTYLANTTRRGEQVVTAQGVSE